MGKDTLPSSPGSHRPRLLLAPVVATLENLFDPETVILGGGMPDCVIDSLIAAMCPLPVSVGNRPAERFPACSAARPAV